MDPELTSFTKAILLPATIVTQFNFWSFAILTCIWLHKVRSNPNVSLSKLGASISLSVVLFNAILLLETVYVTYQYVTNDLTISLVLIINKSAELLSQLRAFYRCAFFERKLLIASTN